MASLPRSHLNDPASSSEASRLALIRGQGALGLRLT